MSPHTSAPDPSIARWFKSTYSDPQGEGDCVQVAASFLVSHGLVLIGDTKTPGIHLAVSPEAFAAFVSATAAGEFGTI
ncbi:DUF397 domain-containing protein [Streptomyces novaecaesareae]|uniref:DUF397 domain-containing protein n=1 Tax=Streptomyces novaecaesareae TaxID=68244 RepID=UPI000691C30A|nr:DUF397 domain-containing protein [Streptomyces novaecaesareae]